EGYKAAKITQAEGEVPRLSLLHEEYHSAPEVTRNRLWVETDQEVLARNRNVIGGDGRQLICVPMGNAPGATQPQSGTAAPAPAGEALLPVIESSPDNLRDGTRDGSRTGRGEASR